MNLLKNIKKWYKETDPFELIAIIFIIIGIIAIILVFFTSSFHEFFDETKHDLTHYAELIGGFVGSLWALAGVLLFYASLASQKSELEEQKNLLVKQIDEVVKQTQEFRKQSDIQAKQQYENTYFQLLRFHNEIITSIVLEITDVDFMTGTNAIRQINGRKSFVEYYDIYKRFFNTQLEILMTGELTLPIVQRIVDNSYRQFFDEYQADLGHYFRNLFNVLYFIDNLEDEEKSKFYLELLHAQLSNYELALLYFHCASSINSEFKILLEKYELLATIPDDEIISMSKRLYNPKAFGKEDFDSDDDMNYGGGENSNNDFSIQDNNNFNLNDSDLSFSENDILSKFASLTKKQKGSEENNEFTDNFANFDLSEDYNDDFNFKFDDFNESGDITDSSLNKLRQNFDKKNEEKNIDRIKKEDKFVDNKLEIQNDSTSNNHINDNLLGDLAAKLKKQMANNDQSNEDDLWGFDDFDLNNFENDLKDENNEENYLQIDKQKFEKSEKPEINILDKLKKITELDNSINFEENIDINSKLDDFDLYDSENINNEIYSEEIANNKTTISRVNIVNEDNLNEIKRKLSEKSNTFDDFENLDNEALESQDYNLKSQNMEIKTSLNPETNTSNSKNDLDSEKKLTNLSKLIQKRRK